MLSAKPIAFTFPRGHAEGMAPHDAHTPAHSHSPETEHAAARQAPDPQVNPAEFWERRYAEASQVWSGRVNRVLAEVAKGWKPGRSLDLGCGEGGDVLWLAEHGWSAAGIDLSPTAVARGAAAASARGLDSARFIAADLGEWAWRGTEVDGSGEPFDLITASFMQSPVELPRELILRAALTRLAPGGRLVILSHAAPPPWAKDHPGEFLSPACELALLALGLSPEGREVDGWIVEVAEVRERTAAGPDGHEHHLEDTVVVVRRTL